MQLLVMMRWMVTKTAYFGGSLVTVMGSIRHFGLVNATCVIYNSVLPCKLSI
jgi:hypothetical protein